MAKTAQIENQIKKDAALAGISEVVKKDDNDSNKELEEMFRAGAHFSYSRSSRHPKMAQYLFGLRNNIDIFDLVKTRACLEKANFFLENLAKENKKILIVGTKPGIRQLVEEVGRDLDMPYFFERWLGGTLTSFKGSKDRIN